MPQIPDSKTAKIQVAEAIAKVHEAMALAEEHELSHALHTGEPCDQSHAAEDAAFRYALLASEDAMISVLESLPGTKEVFMN